MLKWFLKKLKQQTKNYFGGYMPEVYDFNEILTRFNTEFEQGAAHRYASYDFCYNYFHNVRGEALVKDMEKSCYAIGFYLASWGMYRGSSFILERSAFYYKWLIEYIASLENDSIWEIDVNNYNEDGNYNRILEVYEKIESLIFPKNHNGDEGQKNHLTMVTKIMMGVFGCIPAFDQFFIKTFKKLYPRHFPTEQNNVTILSLSALEKIYDFYQANQANIDADIIQRQTIDFNTGDFTVFNYTKAKLIDMYGFRKGKIIADQEREIRRLRNQEREDD